jgi:hypothetical protein
VPAYAVLSSFLDLVVVNLDASRPMWWLPALSLWPQMLDNVLSLMAMQAIAESSRAFTAEVRGVVL